MNISIGKFSVHSALRPVIVACIVCLSHIMAPARIQAYDVMSNPNWYVDIWDSGYSDYIISPHGHEQLSGEWAAAVLYDGIASGEAMWLEPEWIYPDWVSNSQFTVDSHFTSEDDATNPVVGNDTGRGVITNGEVEITIDAVMREGRTTVGLTPGVEGYDSIPSYDYIMLETYTIRNISSQTLSDLSLFQMMHGHPNGEEGARNYGVYDPTPYSDPSDGFPEYRYDMTFFAPDADWSVSRDDIIGFSSVVRPDAWGLGEFPGHGYEEPGVGSLHHLVEADSLPFGSFVGPLEVAGAMRWDLGDLEPGEQVQHTVLVFTGHSGGLPPNPCPIILEPELATNDVGVSHTVTATVLCDDGPAEGIELVFQVVSGPHQFTGGTAVTDADGVAAFSYLGTAAGTDSIQASGDTDGNAVVELSNLAMHDWIDSGDPLTKEQQACVNEMNKNGAKVNRAQLKENEKCLKGFQKRMLTGVEECTVAIKDAVRKAQTRTESGEDKRCVVPFPPFAHTDSATVNDAAVNGALALIDAIFGEPVDDADLATSKTSKEEKAAARCQLEMLKQANKLETTALKELNKAKKTALKRETVNSSSALETALEAVFASNGKIMNARDKLAKGVDKKCAEVAPPDTVFPGYCGDGDPSLSEVSACVIAATRCQVCLKINAMDDLQMNCDQADDGDANGSCF